MKRSNRAPKAKGSNSHAARKAAKPTPQNQPIVPAQFIELARLPDTAEMIEEIEAIAQDNIDNNTMPVGDLDTLDLYTARTVVILRGAAQFIRERSKGGVR